jgi:hypothetical protein
VFFRSATGDDQADGSLFLDIRITRSGRKFARRKHATSYSAFFEALSSNLKGEDRLATVASIDLVFRPMVRWRLPLMADPPKVVEEKLGLGSVALQGVDLSFEDSPAGLLNASLSNDENQQKVTLFFATPIARDKLEEVFSIALEKAEGLSALFVNAEEREPQPA